MACHLGSTHKALPDGQARRRTRTWSRPGLSLALLERSLLAAAADKDSRESGSSLPESPQQGEQLSRRDRGRPANPQLATPALFVPWQEIAMQLGIPAEHEADRNSP